MEPFVAALVEALDDEYDIAMLAHLIIIRVATVAPASLLEGLEQVLPFVLITIYYRFIISHSLFD
jgi:hypothetical protein